jgi:hypothetical protein
MTKSQMFETNQSLENLDFENSNLPALLNMCRVISVLIVTVISKSKIMSFKQNYLTG